jgi:hypothetical protein
MAFIGMLLYRKSRMKQRGERVQDYPLGGSNKEGDESLARFRGSELMGEGRRFNAELEAREVPVYEMG